MELIDKYAVIVEIENLFDKGDYNQEYICGYRDGNNGALYALKDKLDTLEVLEVGVDFGDPKGDKSAKCIVDTKTLEVKEVTLEEIIKSYFNIKNIDNVKITTTGKNLLNLAMRINKFAMTTAFEQYRQIGKNTGNKSLDEEIEKTIKMNDMWGGLMPNTLIKYTAKHFFELGIVASNKAQKEEEV